MGHPDIGKRVRRKLPAICTPEWLAEGVGDGVEGIVEVVWDNRTPPLYQIRWDNQVITLADGVKSVFEIKKAYAIMNRRTLQGRTALAYSAHEACEQVGWMIGECYVREIA